MVLAMDSAIVPPPYRVERDTSQIIVDLPMMAHHDADKNALTTPQAKPFLNVYDCPKGLASGFCYRVSTDIEPGIIVSVECLIGACGYRRAVQQDSRTCWSVNSTPRLRTCGSL